MTLSAIILAAGKATRMKSERVKVLHEICGRPMLSYVLDACRQAGVTKMFVVVGHDKERVMATYREDKDIIWVVQGEQKGTGHACLVCQEAVEKAGVTGGDMFVLCGDGPLIRASTLEKLQKMHEKERSTVALATCLLPDPTGYGRIIRKDGKEDGEVLAIVEQNDATPEQRNIREVNPSYYIFRTNEIFKLLAQVQPNNKKGEYYLTDTLEIARKNGGKVAAVAAVPPEDVLSINSRSDLADVNAVMQKRIQGEILGSGVTLVSPEKTWIEFGVKIGQDTVLEPFTWIGSGAQIAANVTIKAGTVVPRNAVVG